MPSQHFTTSFLRCFFNLSHLRPPRHVEEGHRQFWWSWQGSIWDPGRFSKCYSTRDQKGATLVASPVLVKVALTPWHCLALQHVRYIRLAKETHPDTGGDAVIFQDVLLAYRILSDEERRKAFDDTGSDSGDATEEERKVRLPDLPTLRSAVENHRRGIWPGYAGITRFGNSALSSQGIEVGEGHVQPGRTSGRCPVRRSRVRNHGRRLSLYSFCCDVLCRDGRDLMMDVARPRKWSCGCPPMMASLHGCRPVYWRTWILMVRSNPMNFTSVH